MVDTYKNAIRLEAYFRSMELKFSSLLVCLEKLKQTRQPFINLSITRIAQNQNSLIPRRKFIKGEGLN